MNDLAGRISALSSDKRAILERRLRQSSTQSIAPPRAPHAHTDPWVLRYKENARASLRLFCFAYAGGTAALFRPWADALTTEVEVCGIQLPGREQRLAEKPYNRMEVLIQALAEAIYPYLDRPFAFYGHSMGALVSFELARQLRRKFDRHPMRLFVAAHRAPHLPHPNRSVHLLSPEDFKAVLRSGETPEAVLQNEELMQVLLPALRADFEICGTYTYQYEAPLDLPFSILGGSEDTQVALASLEAWREHSTKRCSLRQFPGSHFFLRSARHLLLAAIGQDLGL